MVDYSKTEEPGNYFEPGENIAYLASLEYKSDEYNYIQMVFKGEKGEEITDKIFEPKGDYPMKNETTDEAIQREIGGINAKMRSILVNFVSEEDIIKKFAEEKPASYKDIGQIYEKLFPRKGPEQKGKLFLWYKNNGYLEVPKFIGATTAKKVFTVEDETLEVTSRYAHKMTKAPAAPKTEYEF